MSLHGATLDSGHLSARFSDYNVTRLGDEISIASLAKANSSFIEATSGLRRNLSGPFVKFSLRARSQASHKDILGHRKMSSILHDMHRTRLAGCERYHATIESVHEQETLMLHELSCSP